jgi:CDP-diacylglycerol---serine O-phosphatidyltransferase
MKHLPNILTVGNLFCGCMAIAFILFNAPFSVPFGEEQYWSAGSSQFYWGALFIGFAGLCDWLDGAAARWLKVESPLGADLDSLSDVVSFGVAPSMIMMKLLWVATMSSTNAMSVSIFAISPAFLIACFGAVRLARFNNAPSNVNQFTGVPIPAIGLTIAGLALVHYFNSFGLGTVLQNKWVLYAIIAFCCWAMISNLKLMTLKVKTFDFKTNWGRYVWLILSLALLPILKFAVIPISFLLYVGISFFYKPE